MHGTVLKWMALVLALLTEFTGTTQADDRIFITGGSLRGRALGMGGAYTSIQDDLSSGLYNPASFRVNAARDERQFRIFFNPVGCAAAFDEFNKYDLEYGKDSKLTGGEALRAASLLLKGMVFTTSIDPSKNSGRKPPGAATSRESPNFSTGTPGPAVLCCAFRTGEKSSGPRLSGGAPCSRPVCTA